MGHKHPMCLAAVQKQRLGFCDWIEPLNLKNKTYLYATQECSKNHFKSVVIIVTIIHSLPRRKYNLYSTEVLYIRTKQKTILWATVRRKQYDTKCCFCFNQI